MKNTINTSLILLTYQNYITGRIHYVINSDISKDDEIFSYIVELYVSFLDALEEFCYNNIDNLDNLKFAKSYICSINFENEIFKTTKFANDFFKNNPSAYEWIKKVQEILKEIN